MENSNYHIVYPRGDRKKLAVVEIQFNLSYELNDYDDSSRQSFHDEGEAFSYAKDLAQKHGLELEGDSEGNYYLD